jgi:hypothetical protein
METGLNDDFAKWRMGVRAATTPRGGRTIGLICLGGQ